MKPVDLLRFLLLFLYELKRQYKKGAFPILSVVIIFSPSFLEYEDTVISKMVVRPYVLQVTVTVSSFWCCALVLTVPVWVLGNRCGGLTDFSVMTAWGILSIFSNKIALGKNNPPQLSESCPLCSLCGVDTASDGHSKKHLY